jgi:hypothetical protein
MIDKDLSQLYQSLVKSIALREKYLTESPQTMPSPVQPGTKPAPGPTTNPSKPSDPFFPKPGQSPRPKAGSNTSVNRFIKKRTRYKK